MKLSTEQLEGVMGMYEMECALTAMINLNGIEKFETTEFTMEDMPDEWAKDGLSELYENDWVIRFAGFYTPTPELVKRAKEAYAKATS